MDIFVINISDADNIKPELLEEFRHKEFTNTKKQKEHCLSYLMTDRILKNVYKTENRELEFVNGKPFLKSRAKFFSISNSGDYLVIAFSDSNCGVDIEEIKDRDFVSISRRMRFNANTLEEFYLEWTKYEAEYKLGDSDKYKSIKQTFLNDYAITALSDNVQETFEIYIQNGETFSNP